MRWKNPILLAAAIFLAALLFYLPAFDAGFIWDDDHFLTQNPLIHAPDGLRRFWLTTEAADYFPLSSTTLWIEWRLWGMGPTGYHALNVLLHALAAVLVWRLLRRLNVPGAWLAGMIFALHPVNVESVAWIAERKNALSLPLYLLSLILYLRFEDSGRARAYAASLAVFLLALLAKTSVVMLPLVLIGCAWWRRGRVTRKDCLRALPFFALSAALAAAEVWFHGHHALALIAPRPEGFFSRLAAAGWAVWFYLDKALLPWGLAMVYPRWRVDPAAIAAWLPDVALAAGFALLWLCRRSWGRPALFAAGYFVLSLFPVLGFADISFMRYSLVADHWQYVAILGPIALVAALIALGLERLRGEPRRIATVVVALLLLAAGVLTWRRCGVFESEETLWADTLSVNPSCWPAHLNLGRERLRRGQVAQAIAQFETAAKLEPDFPEAHYNLGNVFFALKEYGKAVPEYREVLRIRPNDAEVRQRLADALARQGNGGSQ